MPFSTLGLDDRLVQAVRAAGFVAPTAIQSRAIPPALAGKDLVGLAHTGTGKTAAFLLPMLHRLSARKNGLQGVVRALVLTPTRELARQIEASTLQLRGDGPLKTLSVYGGVSMGHQVEHLRRGVDIVVATPGRLLDHLERRTINLSHVEMLVLDEADRMFDMGFIDDVRKIVGRTPTTRQTMLFSATLSEPIRRLTMSIQKEPEYIQVGSRRHPAQTITQHFYAVAKENKLELLAHMIRNETMERVLVFSRTKHGAEKIRKRLGLLGCSAAAIHSDRTQAQRQQALAGFKQKRFRILVATDIAARGIDVEGISHVINFDTPMAPEDYIHRIGRTGRASLKGDAVTFVSGDERKYLRRIEQLIGKRVAIQAYPDFRPTEARPAQNSGFSDGRSGSRDAEARSRTHQELQHSGRLFVREENAGRGGVGRNSSNPPAIVRVRGGRELHSDQSLGMRSHEQKISPNKQKVDASVRETGSANKWALGFVAEKTTMRVRAGLLESGENRKRRLKRKRKWSSTTESV